MFNVIFIFLILYIYLLYILLYIVYLLFFCFCFFGNYATCLLFKEIFYDDVDTLWSFKKYFLLV